MKKKLLLFIVVALTLALLVTPVLAHGHGGRTTPSYSICATESCTKTGLHLHGGRYYQAHYYGDGHDYHGYCDVESCTLTGYHSHDGDYCFGHTVNDGHDYHGYCDIASCTRTGYHTHNGTHSFGHTAYDGHGYHRSGRGHH